MADKNVKDTDIVERLRRLEEQVLPDGMNPSEGASGERLVGVLKGDGTEEPSFKRVDVDEAAVDGSEVVTQADGVAQHNLADPAVHGDAADFIDQDALSLRVATFATASDVPTPLTTGTIVHVEDESQLYQQKESGFEKVSPTRDIAFKDRAETFAEGDVTLTHTDTVVRNGSIKIDQTADNTTTRPDDNSTLSYDRGGLVFNPNKNLYGVIAEVSSNTPEADGLILKESGTGTVLTKDIDVGPGDVVVAEYDFVSGTNYTLELTREGGGIGMYTNSTFPYTGIDLDIVQGSRSPAANERAVGFKSISGLLNYPSGSVTVEWPQPNDVYRWDAATFTATEDGATVEVYVEESTDGGSTWTEIDGPINRGDMITAAADSEVRFRVELSRTDTANNPTLDSIYRRYVV